MQNPLIVLTLGAIANHRKSLDDMEQLVRSWPMGGTTLPAGNRGLAGAAVTGTTRTSGARGRTRSRSRGARGRTTAAALPSGPAATARR